MTLERWGHRREQAVYRKKIDLRFLHETERPVV